MKDKYSGSAMNEQHSIDILNMIAYSPIKFRGALGNLIPNIKRCLSSSLSSRKVRPTHEI